MSDSEHEDKSGTGKVEGGPVVEGPVVEGPVDHKVAEYYKDLVKESSTLDPKVYPIVHKLIQAELDKLSKGSSNETVNHFIDLYNDNPITLTVKAIPPSKVFPKFNYAGRIIGPRGAYLKSLMKETMTKMILLGKGVMKDKEKEEQLRRGSDPRHYHLNEDMHVSIQVTAPPAEAYARTAYALTCLKQQVLSDNRTLEGLPWISNALRILEGGAPGRGHNRSPHYSGHRTYPGPGNSSDPYRRFARGASPYHREDPSLNRYDGYHRPSQSDGRALEFVDRSRAIPISVTREHYRSNSPLPRYVYDERDYYDSAGYGFDGGDDRFDWHDSPQSDNRGPITRPPRAHHAPMRYAPYKK